MSYAKTEDTRKRLLLTMSRLMREQGYNATGISQVIRESGIPKGSLYYHFRNGKVELAASAVQLASERILNTLKKIIGLVPGPVEAVDLFGRFYMEELEKSKFQRGCPIATVTLETAATVEPIQHACQSGFNEMISLFSAMLQVKHVPPSRANDLAVVIVSSIEGALILCKAKRTTVPLKTVSGNLKKQIKETLHQASGAEL